ncbi:SDR family NAD(P)-dependent oxidoreductase [Arenibaculum pallidiluteum]|uniref:SDR family NAD(P)-dependent oxidoreductase n=1 Tax=Arenibaculum pallidiluteum TaxID=2812559 RepID=UPI001A966250|nr:SDR family NAD(P)-dependent oxidoreductase [Arenibaculum pallidiluteum]
MDFRDRAVLVTGAAGNLGRAVAAGFAARGARLALLGRDRASLERTHGPDSADRLLLAADLRDAAAVEAAVAEAAARFGGIDVLCNIAGGFRMGEAVHETSAKTWDLLMDMNARSVLNACRAVVPRMLAASRGRIVNVGAAGAQRGAARMGAYTASKAAVQRLTEAMSAELRERGINVNCVLPSIIDTPENRAGMPGADPARWVSPEDLAQVILFLASDAARAIHGASVPVTGLS